MYLLALKEQDEGKIEWTIPLFDKFEKSISTAEKSIQNFIELSSLIAKYYEMWKI